MTKNLLRKVLWLSCVLTLTLSARAQKEGDKEDADKKDQPKKEGGDKDEPKKPAK